MLLDIDIYATDLNSQIPNLSTFILSTIILLQYLMASNLWSAFSDHLTLPYILSLTCGKFYCVELTSQLRK